MELVKTKYEGIYVTKDGKVFRAHKNGLRECSGSPNSKEYLAITVNGKTVLFHRLIVETFIGEIPEGMEVDHRDGNKHNNELGNLEIVTPEENIDRASKMGNHHKRFSNREVANMIRKVLDGAPVYAVAETYGISKMYLFEVMRKEKRLGAWKLVGIDTPTIPQNKMPAEECAQMIRDVLNGMPKVEAQKKYGVSRSQLFKILRKDFREDAWKLVEGSETIESTRKRK
jgi:Mor family transcriptional regulator